MLSSLKSLQDENNRAMLFLVLSGLSLIVSFFFAEGFPADPAWVAILLCGIPIIKGAAEALIREFDVKADLLVSLALIASVIIGETFAAGEVAFIMTLGAMLEERTVAKAQAGIEKLVHLTPRTARILRGGDEAIVPAEEVQVGDILRVLAGETIAVDGVITEGRTSIDQSVMTGESLPVDKEAGNEVSSGTVNQFGTFEMRAAKVGEDSSLQRMIRLVESADAGKAKIVGIADRWATWIVVIALASAAATWFVTGEVIRAVTILVVFCPCALVLATPTAIMAGIGNATKYGILIREGDALERLEKVSRILFDKTGTLTHGTPTASAVVCSDDFGGSANELLALVASAERRSEHPLGKAIASYYRQKKGQLPPEPQAFQLIPGRGVDATTGRRHVVAGNLEMLADYGIVLSEEVLKNAEGYRDDGCTVIYVAIDEKPAGFVALSDVLRGDSAAVIRSLKEIGVKTAILTGDHVSAARHIAGQVGIDDVHWDCVPETKLQTIEAYQREGQKVCMVGDGINDAPALKTADVGIAMGGIGSDIAIDAADIVLVSDGIRELPHLVLLARRTMRTITFNLTASMVLNFIAIALAIGGYLTPVLGALVHNAGSVAVIINSSLLLTWREKERRVGLSAHSIGTWREKSCE